MSIVVPSINRIRNRRRAFKGTRQIRVILYAKERPGRPSPTPNELAIEDVLAVEHDVVPFDGAHVFEQLQVNAVGRRVTLADGPGDLSGLPVDDAGEDRVRQLHVFICSHSSRALIRPRRP